MSLKGSYLIIIVMAVVLMIPFSAYADVRVSGTTVSGSSDASIVKIVISDSDGKRIWEKSVSVDETFEITMPRLEDGRYTLSMKHGAIGGEQEIVEFTYTGSAPIGSFELEIELPDEPAEDFDSFATKNRISNFERLMDFIRNSEETERRLEVIGIKFDEERGISSQELNEVTRFTPDGLETLEYGIAWTTFRAYNDIIGDARQVLELIENGMSLDTAINFLGIIPTPDPEEEPEELVEIEKITNENEYSPTEREWQTSGPFQIDRSEYAIGESIFLRVSGLDIDEKGEIAFMRPINETAFKEYTTISFDGAKKEGFNFYIDPQISAASEIYSVDDLVGEWIVVFRETNYQDLKFKITEKVLPGTNTESVPKKLTIASFVDKTKDPQSYIDRYNSEPEYKKWFHENYPQYDSIEQAVGLELTQKIPDWVKNIFGWYAADQVSEDELLNAIKYLINEGILVVE